MPDSNMKSEIFFLFFVFFVLPAGVDSFFSTNGLKKIIVASNRVGDTLAPNPVPKRINIVEEDAIKELLNPPSNPVMLARFELNSTELNSTDLNSTQMNSTEPSNSTVIQTIPVLEIIESEDNAICAECDPEPDDVIAEFEPFVDVFAEYVVRITLIFKRSYVWMVIGLAASVNFLIIVLLVLSVMVFGQIFSIYRKSDALKVSKGRQPAKTREQTKI